MSKVLVIGDSCRDIFIYGDIERVSPEAPIPVFKPTHESENDGMSANVVKNLEALGCTAEILTNENDIKKIRYVHTASNQMVLRVDEHDYCRRIHEQELKYVNDWADTFDAIIISDYCKGFLTEDDIEFICSKSDNVFIDTKKLLGDWIINAKFIKINDLEHKKNYERIPNYPHLNDKLIVTRGGNGCDYKNTNYPVPEVSVKDVSGAGDTFLSGLVSEYIKTKDIVQSIKFAQKCTTAVVQKHGVSTI